MGRIFEIKSLLEQSEKILKELNDTKKNVVIKS